MLSSFLSPEIYLVTYAVFWHDHGVHFSTLVKVLQSGQGNTYNEMDSSKGMIEVSNIMNNMNRMEEGENFSLFPNN